MSLVIIIILIPEKFTTEVDEYAQESYIVDSKLKAASSHYIAQDKPVSRNRVSQLTCSACFLLLSIYLLKLICLHEVVYVVLKNSTSSFPTVFWIAFCDFYTKNPLLWGENKCLELPQFYV